MAPDAPDPTDYATLAGTRDEVVREKTGRDWAEWVRTLDAADANRLEHGDIARIVHEEHGVPGWWAQTVTVGYERIRGLRGAGQRRSGEWEANRTRTFPVPVETLFDACAEADARRRWLPDAEPVVRTASRPRSVRLDWDDGSRVAFWLTARGESKSSLAVQHTKLPDRDALERAKAYWGERLDALGDLFRSS